MSWRWNKTQTQARRRTETFRPTLEKLEDRTVPTSPQMFAAFGSGAGGPATVTIVHNEGVLLGQFQPFGSGFTGGIRTAIGDINGDGVPDLVIATGKGGNTAVVAYDGLNVLANPSNPTPLFGFAPFGTFGGGAFVALGKLDGGSSDEIIVGADAGGGPQVNVYSAAQIQARQFTTPAVGFYAYAPNFTGGVRVASGDVNGDGLDDIITAAGPSGGPQVNVFFGAKTASFFQNAGTPTPMPNFAFYGMDPNFTGGIFVVAGDINGDGKADIVTGADAGASPQVNLFSGALMTATIPDLEAVSSIYGFASTFSGGARVGVGIGMLPSGVVSPVLIVGAGPGGGPQVNLFDALAVFNTPANPPAPFTSFFVPPASSTGGVYVPV